MFSGSYFWGDEVGFLIKKGDLKSQVQSDTPQQEAMKKWIQWLFEKYIYKDGLGKYWNYSINYCAIYDADILSALNVST